MIFQASPPPKKKYIDGAPLQPLRFLSLYVTLSKKYDAYKMN